MNYIEIKNEFWKQHRMRHFNDVDSRVFDFLIDRCNSKWWQNPFCIHILSIAQELDKLESNIRRSLDRLKERELIDYAIGERKQGRIILLTWADVTDEELYNTMANKGNEQATLEQRIKDARSTLVRRSCDAQKTEDLLLENNDNQTDVIDKIKYVSEERRSKDVQKTLNQRPKDAQPTIYIYKDKNKDKDKILDNKNNNLLTRTRTQEEVELEKFDVFMQEILDGKHQIWVDEIRMKHGIDNIADYLPDFRSHAILNARVGSVTNINEFKYYFNVSFKYFQKRTPIQLWQQSRDSAETENFRKFCDWIIRNNVNVARDINPPTQKELDYLTESYGKDKVFSIIMELNNRKNLTQRYFSLYRTLLNWINRNDAND